MRTDIRTVMALWPSGTPTENGKPALLIARADVSGDLIYQITKAIYENVNFFANAKTKLGIPPVSQAMAGVELPVHPGAYRYYREEGVGDVAMAGTAGHDVDEASVPAPSASTFDDFDDAALDDTERAQVAAACRQALEIGSLSPVLGDLQSRGCEVYQADLVDEESRRQQLAATRQQLFTPAGGQGGPAIALDDMISEISAPIASPDTGSVKTNPRQPTM